MSLIQVSDLTFAYEGSPDYVFENVSLRLDTSWKLGFTGRNGRGKTTFLHLLQGKFPYQGTITASVGFSYFPYVVPDTSVFAIDVVEEMDPEYEYWRLSRELNGLGLSEELLYRPYATLSGGEQTKLQLAVLFARENQFLLIDEPTNHLDAQGRGQLSAYLNKKQGFLLVSHDRAFLDGCVDHILAINKTGLELQRGNFSTWWENKSRQDAFQQAENEKLKKEIVRLEAAAQQKKTWSDRVEASKFGTHPADRGFIGHKSAKMMARAKAIEGRRQAAVEEKQGLLKNIEHSVPLKLFQAPYPKKLMAQLKDVTIAYGERPVCENISFTIERGDRIALEGRNGSGKSSILKLLCGEAIPHTGEVRLGSGLTVSVVRQDSSQLRGRLSDLARDSGIDESLFLAILSKLDVPREQLERDMGSLSAGQKKKVLLAKSICTPAHLHIWDEPMNYIDVFSRMQLENLLKEFRPTIVFVEHDRVFAGNIGTKFVCLDEESPGP